MKNDDQIHTAWLIWHLMAKLGDLLWGQYEKEFAERYIKIEVQKRANQSDKDSLSGTE
jgi:hypothetical protein